MNSTIARHISACLEDAIKRLQRWADASKREMKWHVGLESQMFKIEMENFQSFASDMTEVKRLFEELRKEANP